MKTVKGALTEFDLRVCENITDAHTRAQAHRVFLSGLSVGIEYCAQAAKESMADGSIDFEEFFKRANRLINDAVAEFREIKA